MMKICVMRQCPPSLPLWFRRSPPADARAAIKFGAEGIGLCRTEHMFFDANRIGVAGVNNAATLVPLTSTRH